MISLSAAKIMVCSMLLLFAVAVAQEKTSGVSVQGNQQTTNGMTTKELGATIFDPKNTLSVGTTRQGDWHKEQIQYDRTLLTDGRTSLAGHVGHARDNMGSRVNNFGLGLEAPKDKFSWNREQSGSAHQDTYRYDRKLWSTNDGRGQLGAFAEHTRNNFGRPSNTMFGVGGRYNFRR